MDINGVKRAKTELKFSSIQFFVSCIILGFTIKHLFVLENFFTVDQMKTQWIIIDCVIMFLTQTYISYSLYMKVQGEIIKNIYTLFFLQLSKVRKLEIQKTVEEEIQEKVKEANKKSME